jgi:hypothetical protein
MDAILQMSRNLKQSFHDVLQSRGREFYNTGMRSLTQYWQKCVKMMGASWKNSLIITKNVQIHVNFFTVTALTFSEEKK